MALNIVLALIFYPGLALTLALALLLGWLSERRPVRGQLRRGVSWRAPEAGAALASMILAAIGLALMPWPFHPAAGLAAIGHPLAIWVALEGAFLAPAIAGMLSPAPLGARAAVREAQMSVAGRAVVWLALAAGLWSGAGWSLVDLPGRLLVSLAALLALPAAIGAGPFGAERSLSAAGAEEGLDEPTARLVRFARGVRGAALLAAAIVALVPPGAQAGRSLPFALPPWVLLLLIAALFLVIGLLIRQIGMALPRLTLPAALRWCWSRALPLALAGLIYLVLV